MGATRRTRRRLSGTQSKRRRRSRVSRTRRDVRPEYAAEDVLAEISEENLHSPEDSLYEYLTEGETDTTPEEVRSRAEELEDEDDKLGALEHRAFATLLDAVQD